MARKKSIGVRDRKKDGVRGVPRRQAARTKGSATVVPEGQHHGCAKARAVPRRRAASGSKLPRAEVRGRPRQAHEVAVEPWDRSQAKDSLARSRGLSVLMTVVSDTPRYGRGISSAPLGAVRSPALSRCCRSLRTASRASAPVSA